MLLDPVCAVDRDGVLAFVNPAYERLLGYSATELRGAKMIDMVHPDDRERTVRAAGEIMRGMPKTHFRNRYFRKDGHVVHLMWAARWSEEDQLRIAVGRDMMQQVRHEAMKEAAYGIAGAVYEVSDLGQLCERLYEVCRECVGVAGLAILPKDAPECDRQLFSGEFEPHWCEAEREDAFAACRSVLQAAHGSPSPTCVGGWSAGVMESNGSVLGAVAIRLVQPHANVEIDDDFRDYLAQQIGAALQRKRYEMDLEKAALLDALTGLPNRRLLHDRMQMSINRAKRGETHLALVFIDLDRFKQVNDVLGHQTGDQLLALAARRLVACVRETDTVARIGGDEFVVLLESAAPTGFVGEVYEAIADALDETVQIGAHPVLLSASLGVAYFGTDGVTETELIDAADARMFENKRVRGFRATDGQALP